MPRCPLCNTSYADDVLVCDIDGTSLGRDPALDSEATYSEGDAISGHTPSRPHQTQGLAEGGIGANTSLGTGRGRPASLVGASLASIQDDDEVTTAAKPEALAAARAAIRKNIPPRIASGSGTAAPESEERDAWSTPFVEPVPTGSQIGANDPESWIGKSLGAYKLLSILGKGGMGCVYLAEHKKLGREVALKVLRNDFAQRKDAVARFFQEARAVNKIRHRNIVDITDFVELDTGVVFIIMEYLDGAPLTNLMKAQGGIDPIRALGLLIQICDGLAAAHSVGIVHRDLKPDNILVVQDHQGLDLIKVLDFGVAKLLDKNEGDDLGLHTIAGSVVGTPAYMSPEQAGGMTVDGRADLYSLGAIMYEIFTKQPLFTGKSFGEFVRKHLTEEPTRPMHTRGGQNMSPFVEEVIIRSLAKNSEDRFQTAQELRGELLSLLATLETSGEMTAQLRLTELIPEPTGQARPPTLTQSQHRDANVPPYYEIPNSQAADNSSKNLGASERVFVSPAATCSDTSLPAIDDAAASDRKKEGEAATQLAFSSLPKVNPNIGMTPPVSPPQSAVPSYATPQFPTPLPPGHISSQLPVVYPGNQSSAYASGYTSAVNNSFSLRKSYRRVAIGGGVLLLVLVALIGGSFSEDTTPDKDAHESTGASSGKNAAFQKGKPEKGTKEKRVSAQRSRGIGKSGAGENGVTTSSPASLPAIVSFQMTSDPSEAQVFFLGATRPTCETPCEVRIKTGDGGSTESRQFIIKAKSFADSTITFDLRNPKKIVFEKLSPLAVPEPELSNTKTKLEKTKGKGKKRKNWRRGKKRKNWRKGRRL